jgi:large subunit ribosomal protein L17
MRHLRAGVHLSRTHAHRKALFGNLVAALFTHERIRTTDVKAKATRRIAERTITWARRLGEVLTKSPEKRTADESARVVHAVRMARRVVRDRDAVGRLFEEIGPRYLGRAGGYTRIVKVGQRPGDAAPMSILELIPEDGASAKGPAKAPAPAAAKGKKAEAAQAKGEKAEKAAAKPAKAETKAKSKAAPKGEAQGKGEPKAAAKKKPAAKKKSDE